MNLPSRSAFRREADAVMASEGYPDFKSDAVRERLAMAHDDLSVNYLNRVFPHVLAGKNYYSSLLTYDDTNPYSGNVLGRFQRFDPEWDITAAIDEIDKAQDMWRETPWKVRAEYLYALAHKLMSDKWTWRFVSALMHDTGKSAPEAWGEYNEVYRFVLIHIWFMFKRYTGGDHFKSCSLAGDYMGYTSKGKGIGLVVAPFNFPAAIPIRMLTLMLAFGNVGILKGATTASLVTRLIFDVCEEVRKETGIGPEGLVNFAPGSGGVAVDAFLSDPRFRIVSFTGSSEVCEQMQQKYHISDRIGGNQLLTGSAETGGVNWVILGNWGDASYVAAQGIRANFGISGQKCSTMRIFLCPEGRAKEMIHLFAAEYDKLKYGNVLDGADLGPVIDMSAKREIDAKIKSLEDGGLASVVYRKQITPSPSGRDIAPTILLADNDAVRDPEKMRVLLNLEIFGPVFTIIPYREFAELSALRKITKYGLTGAIFEKDPVLLAKVQQWLPAGNAYGNRRCTGATGPEAFGGLGGSQSSYNSGLKGYDEVGLYVDTQTNSTVYCPDWTEEDKKKYRHAMEKHAVSVKW